jgi:hypothetical protein
MNNRRRLLRIVVTGLVMTSGVRASDLADGDSALKLLELLKAKDNAFDNAILRYTTWGERRIDFPWWKYPPRSAEEQALMDLGPQRIKFRFREQMITRGRDTTFTRDADKDVKQESDGWSFVPYQKWGETEGVVREISDSKRSTPGDRTFDIRKRDVPVGSVSEQRMAIEFIHGFGFGKRIKTIESIVREGTMRIIRGTIQIWWEDVSTFRVELGDDLLVKKARINCDVRGNLTRFEVTTEGAIDRQGFVFARAGHFKRMALGAKNAKERVGEPSVVKEFSAQFDDVRFHLRDDEYTTLIRMEITPGTQVNDYILNKKYRVEKDNTITNLGPAVPKRL